MSDQELPLSADDEQAVLRFLDGADPTPHLDPPTPVPPDPITVGAAGAMGAGTGTPAPEVRPGTVLGGCRVLRLIARGGMGEVFLARHETLDREVALKIVHPWLAAVPEVRERFLAEARLAARIESPHVVPVLHAGCEAGVAFLTFAYIDGESLAQRLGREGRVGVDEAARIAEQAARGLAAAHALGIVHRDLKPDNLLLGRDGVVRIADFGVARDLRHPGGLTADGGMVGTLSYMAPEQVRAGAIDGRTDLYGLGATLWAALTGRPPCAGGNAAAIVHEVVAGVREPLSRHVPTVPPGLERIVERLLERDPTRRFASAEELLAALAAAREAPGRRASPGPASPRPAWLAALVCAGVALAIAPAWWGAWNREVAANAPTGPRELRAPEVVVPHRTDPAPTPREPAETWEGRPADSRAEPSPVGTGAEDWPWDWPVERRGKSLLGKTGDPPKGWTLGAGCLEGNARSAPLLLEVSSPAFLLVLDVSWPDGAEGVRLGFGEGEGQDRRGYELDWRMDRALEWRRLRPPEVLARSSASRPGTGEVRRLLVQWSGDGFLRCDAEAGALTIRARDAESGRFRRTDLRIDALGPVRVHAIAVHVPPGPLGEPRPR